MRVFVHFGFLLSLSIFLINVQADQKQKRVKRQFSIDDLIHKALSLVRPIFDTSQPIQNDAMINNEFNDGGMRQENVLGARPISILDNIPLCKGNSRICQFISCQAENFKKDENFANLNLAAQVLADKKLRKAVGSNPDAINAVCTEQGMSDSQCKLFSKGFQIVDRFITTVEGESPQPPPLPEEEKLEEQITRETPKPTTTTTTQQSAIIQQFDDELVLTSNHHTTQQPLRVTPPIGPPKLPLQDDPLNGPQRVRIEMGSRQFYDDLISSETGNLDSFGRQPRKLMGSKTWSSQPMSNSIEPDPIPISPIMPFHGSPSAIAPPISPPFSPPGHFLFPAIPQPQFPSLPTLPPLSLPTFSFPAFPTPTPLQPLLPILSIQPLKAPGLTLEKPIVQFSKDSYAEVFRQSGEKFRRIRQINDETDLDFDDVQWTNRRVKRDYYEDLSQARRNLGLGGIHKIEPENENPEVILGEKSEGDDYYTQTNEETNKKKVINKGRDCLALLG
ncbi:unnamed protein product, partial [Mesorhabditis belari]|uniref:Uncharacterized protein n=1 Tax=Mesorhabditis belari TaxID=2138241 RepID=A0AAF3FAW8_9BILA